MKSRLTCIIIYKPEVGFRLAQDTVNCSRKLYDQDGKYRFRLFPCHPIKYTDHDKGHGVCMSSKSPSAMGSEKDDLNRMQIKNKRRCHVWVSPKVPIYSVKKWRFAHPKLDWRKPQHMDNAYPTRLEESMSTDKEYWTAHVPYVGMCSLSNRSWTRPPSFHELPFSHSSDFRTRRKVFLPRGSWKNQCKLWSNMGNRGFRVLHSRKTVPKFCLFQGEAVIFYVLISGYFKSFGDSTLQRHVCSSGRYPAGRIRDM